MNELHFKNAKCFEDFANHVALLLWEGLLHERDLPRPDPHRFPRMSQALNRVFQHHVGACPVCFDDIYGDVQISAFQPPSPSLCSGHLERLKKERAKELDDLLGEVENETVDFLSRHDPKRATFRSLPEKVHHAVRGIGPYLLENIACSHCERS